jgi:hypothetical protein
MEPTITINGVLLSKAQAMTLRCALESMMMDLRAPDVLGSDTVGRSITQGYLERGQEIRELIFKKG